MSIRVMSIRALALGFALMAWGASAHADPVEQAALDDAAKRFDPEVAATLRETTQMGGVKITTAPVLAMSGEQHFHDRGLAKDHARVVTFEGGARPTKATIAITTATTTPDGSLTVTKTQTITHQRSFFGLVHTRTEENERVSDDRYDTVRRTKTTNKTRTILGVRVRLRAR